MKSTYRIGGALAIGIVIILGALFVKDDVSGESTGAVVVSAPLRAPIETADADGDGVQDWEKTLEGKVFETIDTPTSTIALLGDDEEYTPPTTFTGKFSEAFFQDYMQGKINGEDFSDPSGFIGTAVEAIEKNTQSKKHSRAELRIVPDSEMAIRIYGNQVADIMKKHSIDNENEAVILQRALAENDPEILDALVPIRNVYANTIPDMLRIDVPQSLATQHIALLNAFEAILTDVEAMQVAFTDPLYSLARVKTYDVDAIALFNALRSVSQKITELGVTYTEGESGSVLYLFDI